MASRRESGVPSARTVLEVADGLRWTDPVLGASLAEHALRMAGEDATVRAVAERSVIRSLAEVDRFDEVVSRAAPLLDGAQARADREALAGLLVELACAAVGLDDVEAAGRLVEPIILAGDLTARTAALGWLVRALVTAASGDVAGTDGAAEQAGAALLRVPEPEAGLFRRDLARARATARRSAGQPSAALSIVTEVVSTTPATDADGGRRSLLAAADEVDLLLDLDRRDEALARGHTLLHDTLPGPFTVGATARIRIAQAERVHLATGNLAAARSLARSAAMELEAAGDDAAAARAWELVGSVAEHAGELGDALTAVRHGHELDARSRDRRDPALRVLTTIAAAVPELPALTSPAPAAAAPTPASAPTEPATASPPDQSPEPSSCPGTPAAFSEVESLLAEARASVAGGMNGIGAPNRQHGHRRNGESHGDRAPSTAAQVQAALASLLGHDTSAARTDSTEPHAAWTQDYRGANGREYTEHSGSDELGARSSPSAERPTGGRRSRHSAEPDDEVDATSALAAWSEPFRTTSEASAAGFRARPGESHSGPGPEAQSPARWGQADNGLPPGHDPAARPLNGAGRSSESPTADHPRAAEPSASGVPGWGASGSSLPERGRLDDGADRGAIDPTDPLGTGGIDESGGRTRASRGDADTAWGHQPGRTAESHPTPVSDHRVVPPGFDAQDLDDELPLTLADLLAEYHLPDVDHPAHGNGLNGASDHDHDHDQDLAVPWARPHGSGSIPAVSPDPRFAVHPAAESTGWSASNPAPGSVHGPSRRGENGVRLADLLAEAMDAYRHTGVGDDGRPPGPGTAREPGIGTRPG